ncbi:hypothetical protein MGYG_06947 [Nannizzia gypsea CBS 118893]|uniref:Uncharacterized protein n=1 Tax=Arthroderma gypseum (strain ATCC MYA-4604 / CBS 118893) TaxID=535722 RepID=E4V1N3_ARTGP|nr:hypothetical protein MGYG_06947 [Nannizzia gypsea CBS 118893]EFR03948.1 hypothetical protein MGYG_06947 [Nannizzia gypsea CBS 118893]
MRMTNLSAMIRKSIQISYQSLLKLALIADEQEFDVDLLAHDCRNYTDNWTWSQRGDGITDEGTATAQLLDIQSEDNATARSGQVQSYCVNLIYIPLIARLDQINGCEGYFAIPAKHDMRKRRMCPSVSSGGYLELQLSYPNLAGKGIIQHLPNLNRLIILWSTPNGPWGMQLTCSGGRAI